MDVPKLLEAASLLVPPEIATENDITVNDVWEYLVHDEWEVALGLLEELGCVQPLQLSFWETLATAAEQMQLEKSAAWCRWRCHETRNGIIRADLTVRPASEGRRQTPFSGAGVLRPMWDIGNRTPTDEPALNIASVWVEFTPFLGARRAILRAARTPRPLAVAAPSVRPNDHHARRSNRRWNGCRPGDSWTCSDANHRELTARAPSVGAEKGLRLVRAGSLLRRPRSRAADAGRGPADQGPLRQPEGRAGLGPSDGR